MNAQIRSEIIRRWHGGQSMRGIARDLNVARKTVRRAIAEYDEQRQSGAGTGILPAPRQRRASLVDAYVETIRDYLARYPQITTRRLLEELRTQGYTGGYTILAERVGELRERPTTPWVERFETAPGVQAQMDYAVYTLDFTGEGRRRVNLFSYVLGYSRRQYLRFVESQDFETTCREHVRAFEHLGGVAATCLYDNMKVVVLRHEDGQPVYNPRFLAFATHYGYRPVACRPRRPQTKGKVERPFHYVETSLLNGRTFRSLEHLNEVAAWWLREQADVRIHGQTRRRPLDLHALERPHLIELPARPYELAEVVYRTVDVEGFISYAQNRYTVPWQATRPGQVLPIKVTEDEVIVYGPQIEELARHPRFPRGVTHQQSRNKIHRPPRDVGRRRDVLRERFCQLGERAAEFLEGLLKAQRCGWEQAERVLGLSIMYRREDLQAALERALRYGAFSLQAVERILAVQARPMTGWEQLAEAAPPLDPALCDTPTPPRPTSDYQHLLSPETDCHEPPPDPSIQQQPPEEQHAPQESVEPEPQSDGPEKLEDIEKLEEPEEQHQSDERDQSEKRNESDEGNESEERPSEPHESPGDGTA